MAKAETWTDNPKPGQTFNSVAICGDGSRVVAGTFFVNSPPGAPAVTKTVGLYTRDAVGAAVPMGHAAHTFAATAPAVPPPAPNKPKWTRGGVLGVDISRDGAWAACGGGMTPSNSTGAVTPNAGFVHIYELATGNIQSFYVPGATVESVAINGDGSYLAAGADQLYLYRRTGTTWAAVPPLATPFAGQVWRVAITDDANWVVAAIAGGYAGLVRMNLARGTPAASGTWAMPKPPGSGNKSYYVQSVAMAAGGSAFAVAGANGKLYYFATGSVVESPAGTLTFAPRWNRKIPTAQACRWAALSDDGSLVTAIGSVAKATDPTRPGRVVMYRNLATTNPPVKTVWTGNVKTIDGPNCVSMDALGKYVAVADGTPSQNRGGFYLFDGTHGAALWTSANAPPDNYPTAKMNYAVAVAADGNAAIGGSNDGHMYYFAVP